MDQNVLPRQGNIRLSDFTRCLGDVEATLGAADSVILRTAAYLGPEGLWVPFATVVTVGAPDIQATPPVRDLGSVRLVEFAGMPADVQTPDMLKAFIYSWPSLIRGSLRPRGLLETLSVVRHPSQNVWTQVPCWTASLAPADQSNPDPIPPPGPFFDPQDEGRVGDTLSAIAEDWLGDPNLRSYGTARQEIAFVIWDPRAVIVATERDKTVVTVTVSTTKSIPLEVFAQVIDYDGVAHKRRAPVRDGVAQFEVPGSFPSIIGYVFGKDGYCYDQFAEHEGRPSIRGSRLFDQLATRARNSTFSQALRAGESETVEFKEWLPLARGDKKTLELEEAVCAFANTHGGTLYIGVTKNLEVVDVTRHLRSFAGKDAQDDAHARAVYAVALRSRVADTVTPSIDLEVDWIEYGGLHICRVTVAASRARPHYIIASNRAYIRRGANNTQASPPDLRAMTY